MIKVVEKDIKLVLELYSTQPIRNKRAGPIRGRVRDRNSDWSHTSGDGSCDVCASLLVRSAVDQTLWERTGELENIAKGSGQDGTQRAN
jgi:hypothetical protein